MKKTAMLLGFVLAAAFGLAQPYEQVQATLARNFDVPAAGYTYLVFGDWSASLASIEPIPGALGPGSAVNIKVDTSGSSTTIAALTANTSPFQGMVAGDLLIFPQLPAAGGTYPPGPFRAERAIATFTDADTVTVDVALDITGTGGVTFRRKRRLSGTAATDAWFSVAGFRNFQIQHTVGDINATSLDVTLECRVSPHASAGTVSTDNITSDFVTVFQIIQARPYDQCRIGWRVTGDAGTNPVSSYFIGEK